MPNQGTAKALIVDLVRAAGSDSEINANPLSDSQEKSQFSGAEEAIEKWIDENGESITYTADVNAIGLVFEIVAGQSQITWAVRQTTGWAGDSQNFERIPLQETLRIPQGESTIKLRLIGEANSAENVKVHSLELISSTATKVMIDSRKKAQQMRASTDWFVEAKYGMMFHWSTTTQPLRGPQKSYPGAVNAFDTVLGTDLCEILSVISYWLKIRA